MNFITLKCKRKGMRDYTYGVDSIFTYDKYLMNRTNTFYLIDNTPINLLFSDVFDDIITLRNKVIEDIMK